MNAPLANPDKFDLRGHTILIVDDEPANLGVMSEYLESLGIEILIARDGESGLQKAQYARPDLILLDVLMPGINGFETCQRLKADETTKDTPVIFMTALASTEDKVKGFEMGGVDYITKPVGLSKSERPVPTYCEHIPRRPMAAIRVPHPFGPYQATLCQFAQVSPGSHCHSVPPNASLGATLMDSAPTGRIGPHPLCK